MQWAAWGGRQASARWHARAHAPLGAAGGAAGMVRWRVRPVPSPPVCSSHSRYFLRSLSSGCTSRHLQTHARCLGNLGRRAPPASEQAHAGHGCPPPPPQGRRHTGAAVPAAVRAWACAEQPEAAQPRCLSLTCRGRTCDRRQPHTFQCQTALSGPATAASQRTGRTDRCGTGRRHDGSAAATGQARRRSGARRRGGAGAAGGPRLKPSTPAALQHRPSAPAPA